VQVLVWTTVVGWLAAEVILRGRHHGRTEPTVTREWRSLGVIWLAAAAGGVVAGVLAANLHALDLPLRRPAWLVLVLVIAWCGIGLRLWSIATLGRYFQPIVHIQQGHQVVKAGPYRVLRHPAYTGILLAVLGLSLLFANIAAIVVYNVCFIAAFVYRITVEERVLREGLGDEYAEYMRHTHRLIPGVW
jgi:protein-S-isoprenylcysteine O-methyltransferase Ste14